MDEIEKQMDQIEKLIYEAREEGLLRAGFYGVEDKDFPWAANWVKINKAAEILSAIFHIINDSKN